MKTLKETIEDLEERLSVAIKCEADIGFLNTMRKEIDDLVKEMEEQIDKRTDNKNMV